MMYCPNCGTQTSTDQKFCRVCGLGLEKIAPSLGEQLPARMDQSLLGHKERLEKFGVGALSVFGVGVLGYLLYPLGQKLLEQGSLLTKLALVGFVIMLGCGLLSVILFAQAKELGEQAGKRQVQPNEIEAGGSTKELLTQGNFEPVPTITERTTELLVGEKRNPRRSKKESGDFA